MKFFWQSITRPATEIRITIFTIGLVFALLLPILSSPVSTHADTSCSPNGIKTGGNGSSWLGGSGVNVCDNGSSYSDNYGISCVALSGAPGNGGCPSGQVYAGDAWQCVELINRLYLTKGWTTATWSGNGNTLVNSVPTSLIKQNNGSISYINPGDAITLDDGGFGHAAIINTVSGNTINIINQNAQLNSTASIASGSLAGGNASYNSSWFGYQVQAIIHHRFTTTIGLYDQSTSTFYLRYQNAPGSADNTFMYGNSGWLPIVGDWDGNKTTTAGVYNSNTSTFYLKNSNTSGSADLTIPYGNTGWTPISGDWTNSGLTNIGVYNPTTSTFYLNTSSGTITIQYGNSGWLPIMGDWDGNGTITLGVYDPSTSTFYLRNSNTSGSADVTIQYGNGNSGWKPIAGDWTVSGNTQIGVYNPSTSTFYLRNNNGTSNTIQYGNVGWLPITGDWTGL